MEEETEKKPRSHAEFTEWRIEKDAAGNPTCVKYLTVTDDGVTKGPDRVREVKVELPDLRGGDVKAIAEFARKYGFDVVELAERCRANVFELKARATVKSLEAEDRKAGV